MVALVLSTYSLNKQACISAVGYMVFLGTIVKWLCELRGI